MRKNAFGLIYTGESNLSLKDLTYSRSVAAVPFGGRYRAIDFTLSNLVNSGITNVGIVAQRNYHSLMDHLGSGKEWDLHRKRDGLFILPPFVTKENTGLYRGTVDALKSCMGYIRRSSQRYCIFTGSHTIFNMAFDEVLDRHIETGADITVLYNQEGEAYEQEEHFEDVRFVFDENERAQAMEIDAFRPKSNLISMDTYIIEKTLLEYLVEECVSRGNYDFVRDILFKKLDTLKLMGFRYDGFVARLNSLTSYFRHTMQLLEPGVRRDLFSEGSPVYTKVKDEVPAKYMEGAMPNNSIVADGCVIEGEIENCVLFRGVHVAKGASVKNCILMQNSEIMENASLQYVILDKSVIVKRDRRMIGHPSFPVIIRKNAVI